MHEGRAAEVGATSAFSMPVHWERNTNAFPESRMPTGNVMFPARTWGAEAWAQRQPAGGCTEWGALWSS